MLSGLRTAGGISIIFCSPVLCACLCFVIESKYGTGVFLKFRDWKYLLEEGGVQVGGLALAAAKGLREFGRIKAARNRGTRKRLDLA